ncbi:MAG: hypothetical protein IKL46_00100 [Clostridia bacterium]|nr:hypothetical protein [Clostridia bacterium]
MTLGGGVREKEKQEIFEGCKNRIFLLYPLRDIFENIAPFVCSRALPVEEVKKYGAK